MNSNGYWYCPECECEVDPVDVTYQETHDGCGADVEWIEKEKTSENWKMIIEIVQRENKKLLNRVDKLEKENKRLRKAIRDIADNVWDDVSPRARSIISNALKESEG